MEGHRGVERGWLQGSASRTGFADGHHGWALQISIAVGIKNRHSGLHVGLASRTSFTDGHRELTMQIGVTDKHRVQAPRTSIADRHRGRGIAVWLLGSASRIGTMDSHRG